MINEALELYLPGSSHDALRGDARKQSLLAGGRRSKEERVWEEQAGEIEGWRA